MPTGVDTWVSERIDAGALLRFRRWFAAIWLVYDVIDLAIGGTANAMNWYAKLRGEVPERFVLLVLVCIVCEALVVIERFEPPALLMAAAARGYIVWKFFRLNDFLAYTVIALLLAFLPARRQAEHDGAPRWLADVLLAQTAWIYLATGFLKLNDPFLDGGHFLVRHGYLDKVGNWPYPGFVADLLEKKSVNAVLSWFAVVGELSLGVCLALCLWWGLSIRRSGSPRSRGRSRVGMLALVLAVAIHGWAAIAVNVWFFGATMIALVWCVTRPVRAR